MIAEVRAPRGLCNIIPDLFIKFNSLLETACTHDLGTGRCGKAPGVLLTHLPYTPPHHAHTFCKLTNTCSTPAHTDTQTRTHLITHVPPPPPPLPPLLQRLSPAALPIMSNANLSLDEAAVFLWRSFCALLLFCFF